MLILDSYKKYLSLLTKNLSVFNPKIVLKLMGRIRDPEKASPDSDPGGQKTTG